MSASSKPPAPDPNVFRSFVETSADGVLVVDSDGIVRYANPRAEALFADRAGELVGSFLAVPAILTPIELALPGRDGYRSVEMTVVEVPWEGGTANLASLRDITERKRSEEYIRSLSHVPAENPNFVMRFSPDGTLLYANPSAQPLLQLWGREIGQRLPDDWVGFVAEAFASGANKVVEVTCRESSYSITLTPIPGADYVNAYGQEITEREAALRALHTSETEFRTLAESMPQIVWITQANGGNIYFNQQWIDYTGLTLEESLGRDWSKPFHPDDRQAAWAAWKHATDTVGTYSIESRLRRADGTYRWWLVRGVPLLDAHGKLLKWFGTCTDIHDLKMAGLEIGRANLDLRESERRFTDLLANIELLAVMLDRDARITYCNDHLLRLTGWQAEEVFGRVWFDVFSPPDLTDMTRTVFAALLENRDELFHHENQLITRSGARRLIRWNNSVLRSAAGDVIGTASIGEDITERKATESRVTYLKRVYSLLSGINTLIVRVSDRDYLFQEACRIAVAAGGFRMAMIAIVDRRSTKIVPVATAGKDEELLAAIKNILSSSELASSTLIARAIRNKQTVLSNDSQNDPQIVFGNQYANGGVRSLVILPLIVADEAIGVIALYASEIEFFHEEELMLLTQLTGDVAFAIDHLNKQEKLDYLAYYDALTGLANRRLFIERVGQNARSATRSNKKFVLFLIDLERFRNVNDTLGRPAGDALLRLAADHLVRDTGDASLIAHIEADHFAALLPEVANERDGAQMLEKKIQAFMDHPFHLDDAVFRIGVKVGAAVYPDHGADAETLFRNAEVALKQAKATGGHYLFYAQEMAEAVVGKLTMENELRQALDKGEFVLYYQPKVDLASGKLTSAEALIRWNDPRTGLVPPGKFIPLLEETGLIYEVGRWALRQAVADYLRWHAAGWPGVRIAVNVSSLQLRDPRFIDDITEAIAVDAHAAAGIELEITETLIMEDVKRTMASLGTIRALGITIAIDDFGTGFSSLGYLAKLPVDTLKIDRSFVMEMTSAPEGLALVSTIINLAHSLKLKVVAEGVETEEQSRLLRLLSCDEIQGFLFSKPLPVEIFESRFLTRK